MEDVPSEGPVFVSDIASVAGHRSHFLVVFEHKHVSFVIHRGSAKRVARKISKHHHHRSHPLPPSPAPLFPLLLLPPSRKRNDITDLHLASSFP